MASDDYKIVLQETIDSLPDDIPPELRKRMRRSLESAYEFSLSDRLKDLDQHFLKPTNLVRLKSKERYRLVMIRNYLTHYSKHLEGKVRYGRPMHDLLERLVAVVTVILLQKLDVSPATLRGWLQQRPNFGRFLE